MPEPGKLREVNIKTDMPTVSNAIKRVTFQIYNAKALGFTAVKIIHGYGSSGKGGSIRTETRRYLQRQKDKHQIRDFIPGEQFSIFDEATRAAFLICDDLRRDSDLERSNNGVTIVIL
ncbi:MAG: Smr/MutS family protein [Oscillospiraceae bacterium]